MEDKLYSHFYEVEKKHWWFVARQSIVADIIRHTLKLSPGAKVLDVGCGTGAILEMLSQHFEAYGTDTSQLAIDLCRKRGLTNVFCCTLDTFPRPDLKFDLITMLDVVEHIEDDLAIVKQAGRFLNRGGLLLVTVPAYQFLWSNHDEVNHHKRRYARSTLRNLLTEGGFSVKMLSYFNTILFPAALAERLIRRLTRSQADTTLDIPAVPLNSILAQIFASEKVLLRKISLPFGLSVVAIGRVESTVG